MRRFRRKSLKPNDGRDRDPSSGTEGQAEATPTPPPLLPSLKRQSLILPHLTKRFSLLNGPDGQLVDLATLNIALSERVKTQMLTSSEADAILHQFQLERGQQSSAPAVPRVRPQRRDWSLHPTDTEEEDESVRESFLSNSTAGQTTSSFSELTPSLSPFNASTFGRTSAIPFPHSPESTASTQGSFSPALGSTGSSLSTVSASGSHPYKRGGNSLFAGRVQNAAHMSRNKSSTSVASSSSRSAHTAGEEPETSAEADGGSQDTSLEVKGASVSEVEEGTGEENDKVVGMDDNRSSAGASLSQKQLQRISRVLDDIEQDLIKGTSVRSSSPENTTDSFPPPHTSFDGPASDTEAMDPHFHRLISSPIPPSLSSNSRRPSAASSLGFAEATRRPSTSSLSTKTPSSDAPSPSLAPATVPASVEEEVRKDPEDELLTGDEEGEKESTPPADAVAREEAQGAAEVIPLPSPDASDIISVDTSTSPTPIPVPSPSLDNEDPIFDPFPSASDAAITHARSREVSNTPSDYTISPLSPATTSASLPSSARSDVDPFSSDQDEPFDFSFGSTVGHGDRRAEDDGEQVEVVEEPEPHRLRDDVIARQKRHRRNVSIISSTGSSYHAAAEDPLNDNDDPLATPSPQLRSLMASPTLPSHGEEEGDEHLRVVSESMVRQTSNELLETINSSSPSLGEADLALEDLLMIQETLVRSASRRAAARKAGLSPSSPNDGSDFGPRRGSGSDDAYSWPRKGSMEGSGSGSDGRRGSESDGRWGGSDGRRGSDGLLVAGGRRRSSGVESGLSPSGYRVSRATQGTSTSATGSSPQTNGVPTPSSQSDAFEFSSLVGSPDSGAWEGKKHLASPRQPEEHSPLVNAESPLVDADSPSDFDSPNLSAFHSPISPAMASNDGHIEREEPEEAKREEELQVQPQQEPEEVAEAEEEVGSLGEAVKLDDVGLLRVPRSSRDPAKTQSVLIRDVRNQATLATIALKKTAPKNPTSPIVRSKSTLAKSKSIRKGAISSPQLVSGTSDIPSVPILNPDIPSPTMSPKSPGRSASKKEKRDADGTKSRGIGSRFKNLLKKQQSRDQLPHLNGDEVTPFDVDADRNLSPPFTPPNQETSTFSTPDYNRPPQQSDGLSDGRHSADYLRTRSPSGLAAVAESPEAEQGSPSNNSSSSGGTAGNKMSLTRLLSRKRTASNRPRRESETSLAAGSGTDGVTTPDMSLGGSPLARTASPGSSIGRRPSIEQEVFGLGLGPVHTDTSSRAPISYDIGSMRRRMGSESSSGAGHEVVVPTAPLAPVRRSPPQPLDLQHFSFPPNDSAPPPSSAKRESSSSQHRHTESSASDNSMRRLWEAAEDLGMPRDKVEELVNLSYAQSPTASHAHSGSTSSTLGRQSQGSGQSSQHGKTSGSSRGHRRGLSSNASGSSRQRPASSVKSGARQSAAVADGGLTVDTGAAEGMVPGLRPPLTPSGESFRSSGYAGSVFDLYGSEGSAEREDEDEEGEVVLKPGSIGVPSPTLSDSRFGASEGRPDSLVWRVIDDLRRPTSGVSSSSDSFGFNSRPSSTQSTDGPDPLAQLLRHHARNRSSGSIHTPAARFPSVYAADEQRLMELGKAGGIADVSEGQFLVRPKEVVEEEAEVERARRDSRQEEFSLSL